MAMHTFLINRGENPLFVKCEAFFFLDMDEGLASRGAQSEGDFQQAIERFTEAITLNRNDHVLFSNRSYAYAKMGRFIEALEDAKRCQELKPDWSKVWIGICPWVLLRKDGL